MRRIACSLGCAALMLGAIAVPAGAAVPPEKELVGEATAQAFTLRGDADEGGATPLPFFFGSYADAYLTTPPAAADGQASWYNFGIAETAIFKPPEECTPEKNAERVRSSVEYMATWLTDQAIPSLMEGNTPAAPIPALPCGGGRLPGFAQSRYPASESIGPHASDDLLVSAACRGDATCSDPLRDLTGGILQGGAFAATATNAPSQTSDALVVGITLDPVLRIASARSVATSSVDKSGRVVSTATWALKGLCVLPGVDGCAVSIQTIEKTARVVRSADGKIAEREARTVITGVRGSGSDQEISAGDLGAGVPALDLGDFQGCAGCRILLEAVSATGGCGDPTSDLVADAGGLRIFARGNGTVTLPIPVVGNAVGGGLMLGGACASGRLSAVEVAGPPVLGGGGTGGTTVVVPPVPGVSAVPPSIGGPQLSAPQVVTRQNVRYVFRSAPAWRTAPYWGSALGALLLLGVLGFVFRERPVLAPVVRSLDRFARQFVRG